MKKMTLKLTLAALLAASLSDLQAVVTPMLNSDLTVFFNRSIEPNQGLYDENSGGSTWVTGEANPLGGEGALRFTDQSSFVSPRIVGLLEPAITDQFRISLRAYNNVLVEGGSRGARLRFGVNEIGLVTSESRVAATITFKQDNTIQAKGDLPDHPGALMAKTIELHTAYMVDIIVNVNLANSFSYTYLGNGMTLDPGAYHVMVDGELLPGMPESGLPFALASGTAYADWVGSFGGAVDQIGFVSATADAGVDWYFSEMVLATGLDIDVAGGPAGDTWGGYALIDGKFVDTVDLMGFLQVEHSPWVYSYRLNRWLYIPEEHATEAGIWAFVW